MSENPEDDDFEDENLDETGDDDGADLDRVMKDLDLSRKRGQKAAGGEPSWRRLERLREDKRTAELTSDFDDYDLGDGAPKPRRGPGR